MLATGLAHEDRLVAVMDIGTNTELLVGNRDRILAASCPAGPAFEGGAIACGMPGLDGAIEDVALDEDGTFRLGVIGGGAPAGICGSGLVDLLSELLRTGRMNALGRFEDAIRVLTFGRSFDPKSDELRDNLVHVYAKYIDATLAAGKDQQALALLGRAAAAVPDEKDFAGSGIWFIHRGEQELKAHGYDAALSVIERGLPLLSAVEGRKLRELPALPDLLAGAIALASGKRARVILPLPGVRETHTYTSVADVKPDALLPI